MGTVWTDAAIRSQSEDELGRVPYSVHAARLIAGSHNWDDSIVFGLTGAWGSGKSSMLAMIEEELRKTPKWRVARFTPWATSDVPGLLAEFYASLGAVLPPKRGQQVRAALGTLAEVAAPAASLIPIAGGAVSKATALGGAALSKQVPWDRAFQKTVAGLRKLDVRVLVIADDIDRLQGDELLAFLKVVRLLGRFPGVHYLLAYDEQTLFTTLGRADLVGGDAGAAQRFMEKIVQYPLVVPALSSRQLLARLEIGLDDVHLAVGRRQIPPEGRLSELYDVAASALPTPRAVDRFLAQLRHHLPLIVEDDINTEDVIVLTILRTAFPTLYAQLPRWRSELTSGHTGEWLEYPGDSSAAPFNVKLLLQHLPASWQADAARLLRDLFPALPTPGPQINTPRRPRSVSDERYFDRYFTMSVPEHDVSDVEVARAIGLAETGDGRELVALLEEPSTERVGLVIDKASAFTAGLEDEDSLRLALLRLLVPRLNNWPESDGAFTSLRGSTVRWAVALLMGLSDDAATGEITTALQLAPSLTDRSELLYRAGRTKTARSPAWFPAIAKVIGQEVAAALVEHIEQRDDAPTDQKVGWLVTVLAALDQGAVTRPLLVDGLTNRTFTIADVAARFVMAERDEEGDGRILEVRRDEFEALVPPIDDDWYRSELVSVDLQDLSWANLRAAAAGRFARPNATSP